MATQIQCPFCSAVFTSDRADTHFCPLCGRRVDTPAAPPDAPVVDALPQSPSAPGRRPSPWEQRAQYGWFAALLETWRLSMFAPDRFFRELSTEGPIWDAILYAWLVSGAPIAFGCAGCGALGGAAAVAEFLAKSGATGGGSVLGMLGGTTFFIGTGFALSFAFPIAIIVYAAITHVSAVLVGASRHGFQATLRAVAYASSPTLLALIPCVGWVVAIYRVVLTVFGIEHLHETTRSRAVLAVLLPVLLCCVGWCGLFGVSAVSDAITHSRQLSGR